MPWPGLKPLLMRETDHFASSRSPLRPPGEGFARESQNAAAARPQPGRAGAVDGGGIIGGGITGTGAPASGVARGGVVGPGIGVTGGGFPGIVPVMGAGAVVPPVGAGAGVGVSVGEPPGSSSSMVALQDARTTVNASNETRFGM